MIKDELLKKLKRLRRHESETESKASVCEAIDVLITSIEFLLNSYQPERSKREDCKCPPVIYERNQDGSYPELEKFICRCGALNIVETQ